MSKHWTPTATLKGFVCKTFGLEPAQREEVLVAALKNKIDGLFKKNRAYKCEVERMGELLKKARENERGEKVRVMNAMRRLEEKIRGHSSERDEIFLRSREMRRRLENIIGKMRREVSFQGIQRKQAQLESAWEKRTERTRVAQSNEESGSRKWSKRLLKSKTGLKKSFFSNLKQRMKMEGKSGAELRQKSTIWELEENNKQGLIKRTMLPPKGHFSNKKGSLKDRISTRLTRHKQRQLSGLWNRVKPGDSQISEFKMNRGSVKKEAQARTSDLSGSLFKSIREKTRDSRLLESSFLNLEKSQLDSRTPRAAFLKPGKTFPGGEFTERKNSRIAGNWVQTEWASLASPKSRSVQSNRIMEKVADEDKWREVLTEAVDIFQTVADAAKLQKMREQKTRNVVCEVFLAKSRWSRAKRSATLDMKSNKWPKTKKKKQGKARKRVDSAPLIKIKMVRMPQMGGKMTLLEDKVNMLLNERNELEKKNKKKQQKLIEEIMNEKVYADSLRDITVQLEQRLARKTRQMCGILEKHGLEAELEFNDDEGQKNTPSGSRKDSKQFDFEKVFAVEIGGQRKSSSKASVEFDQLDFDGDFEEELPDLKKEEKQILEFKEQIDENKKKISELTEEQGEMKNDLKQLEEKIKETDTIQKTEAADEKRRKITKYKQQISALRIRNINLEEEIRHKRNVVDEYSRARAQEMRELRRNLYGEYLLAREKMEEERQKNREVVMSHQQAIHQRNMQMVHMVGKFQKVKRISDKLKKHYQTLRNNGIDVGSVGDCRWINGSRRVH